MPEDSVNARLGSSITQPPSHPATQARHATRGLQHVVLRLQRGTHLFALLQRQGQLQFLPAQFQLVHGLAGQHLQRL